MSGSIALALYADAPFAVHRQHIRAEISALWRGVHLRKAILPQLLGHIFLIFIRAEIQDIAVSQLFPFPPLCPCLSSTLPAGPNPLAVGNQENGKCRDSQQDFIAVFPCHADRLQQAVYRFFQHKRNDEQREDNLCRRTYQLLHALHSRLFFACVFKARAGSSSGSGTRACFSQSRDRRGSFCYFLYPVAKSTTLRSSFPST